MASTQSTHYRELSAKWQRDNTELKQSLWEKHKSTLEWLSTHVKHTAAVGSASAMMLLNNPLATALPQSIPVTQETQKYITDIPHTAYLINDLSHELPDIVEPLTTAQESLIAQTLTRHFGVYVSAELQGIRLNRSYGYIGLEQRLSRWPGDNRENTAPGLGAYGYFSDAGDADLTKATDREKWYIAVQTFLAPGYNDNVKTYNDFFRFRKVLVVNPENGKAVVADIGDAGPSPWTGKSLGGSPDVMNYLERVDGAARGPVLYFFIDDPENSVPLGPIAPKEQTHTI